MLAHNHKCKLFINSFKRSARHLAGPLDAFSCSLTQQRYTL
jgi:hypothetical protein